MPQNDDSGASHQEGRVFFGGLTRAQMEGICRRTAQHLPDRFEIEDIVQTAFLGLSEASGSYDPSRGTERFWAWSCVRRKIQAVYTGASHTRVGRENWQYATETVPLVEALPQQPRNCPPPPPPPASLPLEILPPLQRRVVELIYDQGLSERAIARQHLLGRAKYRQRRRPVAIGWRRVKSLHRGALDKMREHLSQAA